MKELFQTVMDNVTFVAEILLIVAGLFLTAVLVEKLANKKQGVQEKLFTTKKVAMIGMFSAIAMVLMLFELPLPFAPPFYKLDLSELPVLVGGFAFGPAAAVMIEFAKILLKLFVKGTSTAFVGELANFAVGCSFILPASIIYLYKKNKKNAFLACGVGTLILTVFGTAFNAIYLLPKFAQIYGMPLDAIIGMGTAINPAITDLTTLVMFAVAPLNIIKGVSVSVITMLVYKKLSHFMKATQM